VADSLDLYTLTPKAFTVPFSSFPIFLKQNQHATLDAEFVKENMETDQVESIPPEKQA